MCSALESYDYLPHHLAFLGLFTTLFDILHTTADFVVIDKPAGISVHKDQNTAGLTMLLEAQMGQKLYLVHRLDKMTSGVMVFAKHLQAAQGLSELFRQRQVSKYYLALSDRKPKRKQGLIIGDMEKSRRSAWRLLKRKDNPAITQFFSQSVKPGLRLFLLKPTTGKTHQIRVALKSEGAAIVGDELYGGTVSDRTYLHAYALAFEYLGVAYRFKQLPHSGQFFTDCTAIIQQTFAEPETLNWPNVMKKYD